MLHSGWLPSQEQRLFFYSIFFFALCLLAVGVNCTSRALGFLWLLEKKVMGKREGNETELLTQVCL